MFFGSKNVIVQSTRPSQDTLCHVCLRCWDEKYLLLQKIPWGVAKMQFLGHWVASPTLRGSPYARKFPVVYRNALSDRAKNILKFLAAFFFFFFLIVISLFVDGLLNLTFIVVYSRCQLVGELFFLLTLTKCYTWYVSCVSIMNIHGYLSVLVSPTHTISPCNQFC